MIDNQAQSRFELEENGHLAWANYRIRDGQYVIPHVEADLPLRGTGAAASRLLMQQIVDHARTEKLGCICAALLLCARAWFERHPEAEDVLG